MPTSEEIIQVVAINLPSPLALDEVWRQTKDGAVFDLDSASSDSIEEWHSLARALSALWRSR